MRHEHSCGMAQYKSNEWLIDPIVTRASVVPPSSVTKFRNRKAKYVHHISRPVFSFLFLFFFFFICFFFFKILSYYFIKIFFFISVNMGPYGRKNSNITSESTPQTCSFCPNHSRTLLGKVTTQVVQRIVKSPVKLNTRFTPQNSCTFLVRVSTKGF